MNFSARKNRVAIQLYPDASPIVVDFLGNAGALPDPVWPYVYLPSAGGEEILRLIEEIAAGHIDAVAFTSSPQVGRLFAMAQSANAVTAVMPRRRSVNPEPTGWSAALIFIERGFH